MGKRRSVLRRPRSYVFVRVTKPTRVKLMVLTRDGRTLRVTRTVRPLSCA